MQNFNNFQYFRSILVNINVLFIELVESNLTKHDYDGCNHSFIKSNFMILSFTQIDNEAFVGALMREIIAHP